jgi:hypothetical protein
VAALVGGTLVAAAGVDAGGETCPTEDPTGSAFPAGLQLWPFGTTCDDGSIIAPSVPVTLVAIVATALVLVAGHRPTAHAVARALVVTVAVLALNALLIHGAGYPPALVGGLTLSPFLALAVDAWLRRTLPRPAGGAGALALGGGVWFVLTFFVFWGWPAAGPLLAPVVAAGAAFGIARARDRRTGG